MNVGATTNRKRSYPSLLDLRTNFAITTELRGRSLKLSFTIILKYGGGPETEKITSVFNIDDLAEVRFKFLRVEEDVCTFISLRKHASAKASNVKVDVRSAALHYSKQWVCTEHWIEWQDMGVTHASETQIDRLVYLVIVPMNIIVIEQKSFHTEKIYEDEEFTDFHLGTDEGRVAVHKVHLAAHSEVFKMMLSHEWKEKNEGCIQLEGVTLQTLKDLKQYMYLGSLPDEGLRPLLLIARCYLMDNLKSECISKLARTATMENLEDLMNFATDNKITELVLAMLQVAPDDVVHGAYQLKKESKDEQKDGE